MHRCRLYRPQVVADLGLAAYSTIRYEENASVQAFDTYLYHARVDITIGYSEAVSSSLQRCPKGNFYLSIAGLPHRPHNFDVILGVDFIDGFHLTLYLEQDAYGAIDERNACQRPPRPSVSPSPTHSHS